jgi:secreted PhoX family phosphatase
MIETRVRVWGSWQQPYCCHSPTTTPCRRVALFGSLSMPGGAEASGIYFGAEPGTLFVNVQYADDANDMTLAVTRE